MSGDSIILNNEWLDNEWNIFLYLKELLFTNNSFQRETLSFYNLPFYTEENFKSIGNYLMIMQVNSMYNELAVYLYSLYIIKIKKALSLVIIYFYV